jgi:glycosyltransferase involved in cell wall biosynthesis
MGWIMRVVALLAVRNEELYIERCLRHLHEQGIETCLIDNGSTDRTLEIARTFLQRGVFRIENFPFNGIYQWEKILEFKSYLAKEINADWFIHHDADEIREAPKRFANLVEGIKVADSNGYNAIDSDEFVFVPVSEEASFEGRDYVGEMKHYYYFKPQQQHRVNIWKKTDAGVDLASSGGHRALFANQKLSPENFILRHYILLSKKYATEKYGKRKFAPDELAKGWHGHRARFNPENLMLPVAEIKLPAMSDVKLVPSDGEWDLSDIHTTHLFM